MATTNFIDHIQGAAALMETFSELLVALFVLLLPVGTMVLSVYFSYCIFRSLVSWLRRRAAEKRAKKLIGRFDTHQIDFMGSLEDAGVIDEDGNSMQRRNLPRGWARVRKDRLSAIAFALADEAYFQFGQREKSEANDLCTRKFLRDMISEYSSLRAKEKNIILVMALSLSYVGPTEVEEMREFETTEAYGRRASATTSARF